jgi:hypothetical protein
MRRKRAVRISVSEDFYRILESEKNKFQQQLNSKMGIHKNITTTNFTDIIANKKIIFPRIKIGGIDEFKKQKRRRI